MSACEALLEDFKEWRRLAEAERLAIRSRNWRLALECQGSRRQLQGRIDARIPAARCEWEALGAAGEASRRACREMLLSLADHTARNRALIQRARESLQTRISELVRAGQNLRRLQASYTVMPHGSWSSVS
jgi:hypothetical protein